MLPCTQCLRSGSVEVPETRLLRYGMVPKVLLTSDLEGLCIVWTSLPSILLEGTETGGIVAEKLAGPPGDSPPWGVSNREPLNNDYRADIIGAGTQAVLIKNLATLCSRISLKSIEISMHVLSIGESTLQGETNRLCSHKARRRVDNDSVKEMFPPVKRPSMSALEVSLHRREELEP